MEELKIEHRGGPMDDPQRPETRPTEKLESLESERNQLAALAARLEADLADPNNWRTRRQIARDLGECRARLAELNPQLKKERRLRRGTDEDQRTRHDVMEDVLIELKQIKEVLISIETAHRAL